MTSQSSGTYSLDVPCKIKSLPNSKGSEFSVTKISLATEELFKLKMQK